MGGFFAFVARDGAVDTGYVLKIAPLFCALFRSKFRKPLLADYRQTLVFSCLAKVSIAE